MVLYQFQWKKIHLHLKLQQKYISVIINNTASGKGGALLLDWGSAYVVDSNITGNEAIDGGGIWFLF